MCCSSVTSFFTMWHRSRSDHAAVSVMLQTTHLPHAVPFSNIFNHFKSENWHVCLSSCFRIITLKVRRLEWSQLSDLTRFHFIHKITYQTTMHWKGQNDFKVTSQQPHPSWLERGTTPKCLFFSDFWQFQAASSEVTSDLWFEFVARRRQKG